MFQNGVWVVGVDIGDGDDQMDSMFMGREAEDMTFSISKGPSHL